MSLVDYRVVLLPVGFPRSRGDEPRILGALPCTIWFSPLTRG